VPEHANFEDVSFRAYLSRPGRQLGGLVDDPRPGADVFRQLPDAEGLQNDQPCGPLQRPPGLKTAVQVLIEIRAGQGDYERQVGMAFSEALGGIEAATRVQCNQNIAGNSVVFFLHRHPVPELAQDASPAHGGDPVAPGRSPRRWGNEKDPHRLTLALLCVSYAMKREFLAGLERFLPQRFFPRSQAIKLRVSAVVRKK